MVFKFLAFCAFLSLTVAEWDSIRRAVILTEKSGTHVNGKVQGVIEDSFILPQTSSKELTFPEMIFLLTKQPNNSFNKPELAYSYKLGSLKMDNFDPKKPCTFLVHGDLKSPYFYIRRFQQVIIPAYLLLNDVNLFYVTWGKVLTQTPIIMKTLNVTEKNNTLIEYEQAGKSLLVFINSLVNKHYVNPDRIHLIGHQKGSLVVSVAAANANYKFGRITALDPIAGKSGKKVVDKSLADWVEAIHTSGYLEPVGHIDIYINGGMAPQPGCLSEQRMFDCSSERAYEFYIMSAIFPQEIDKAHLCDTYDNYLKEYCNFTYSVPVYNKEKNPMLEGRYYVLAQITGKNFKI